MKRCMVLCTFFVFAVIFASVGFAEEKEIDRADAIRQAQEGLATLGLYTGEADGKMNMETRKAIKEFKKKEMDKKMATGALDKKTCDVICKKADEKKQKDMESEKPIMDKAMEKIDEGKAKAPSIPDLAK